VGLGYDVQGNLANKSGINYTFDYGNRLRAGGPETYRYDVQGRRARSNSSAGLIYSLYAQSGQLLFQRDERSGKRRQYVYLGKSLVAESDVPLAGGTATVTYQHTDALGSPVATTNSAKTVLQRSEYEPYGYLLNRPMQDGPGYTGHVTDAATGLVYMQQRYYDPLIARFLSRDAVTAYDSGDMRQFNGYDYAYNNPYTLVDDDGMAPNKAGVANASYIQMFLSHGTLAELSSKHDGNKNRYFYTKQFGWVDVRHFGKMADLVETNGLPPAVVKAIGAINEVYQWLQEWGDAYRSGFSPEDIPSNSAGASFGEFLKILPVLSLAEAFREWAIIVGATEAQDPKSGYGDLPEQDPAAHGGSDRGSNTSSDPPEKNE
jgi:RHS repeat-associated protein